jgi:hypothetical protein
MITQRPEFVPAPILGHNPATDTVEGATMKKVLLGTSLLLVLLAAAAVFYVYSNLDRLVQQAIETAGTEALGTQVSVAGVKLELTEGRASVSGFAIANPEGFSDNALFSVAEAAIALDLAKLSQQHIGIQSILARNPRVYFESRERESNIDALRAKLASGETAAAEETSAAGTPIQLSIARVDIEQIEAVLVTDLLQEPVQTQLEDIHLENLQGTPEEIAQQIVDPLLRQLGSQIASSLLKLSAQDLKESAADLGRSALEKAGAAGESIKEGFNNLLERN